MVFDPELYKLSRKDDAFHGLPSPKAFEWWYFDAFFDNGYSMAHTWHIGELGTETQELGSGYIVFTIYDPDGKKTEARAAFPANAVSLSTETCDVKMGDNRLRGEFPRYEIHLRSGDVGAELLFENLTQGFRNPPDGVAHLSQEPLKYTGWVCAQPRAKVTGKLILAGKEMRVNGVGYHDHNWGNVHLQEIFEHWYWGRIFLPNHTLVYGLVKTPESVGSTRGGMVIAIKGEKLLEVVQQLEDESSNLKVDEVTGAKYPGKWVLKIKGTRIKGELIHRPRKIMENVPLPWAARGRGYFRILSDCDVKLDVDGEKVKAKTQIIQELMLA
jgi:hypothetical protein